MGGRTIGRRILRGARTQAERAAPKIKSGAAFTGKAFATGMLVAVPAGAAAGGKALKAGTIIAAPHVITGAKHAGRGAAAVGRFIDKPGSFPGDKPKSKATAKATTKKKPAARKKATSQTVTVDGVKYKRVTPKATKKKTVTIGGVKFKQV